MPYKNIMKCGLAGLIAMISLNTLASTYPDRSIRLIVPFPPGGSVDYVARVISQKLAENMGQAVIVENRGGASGTIGTQAVARAAPDGYTLLLVFDSHAVNGSLYDLKYDTFDAFDYISLIGTMPQALVTSKQSGLSSTAALLEAAKNKPGELTYGSSGVGGSNHLNPVAFTKQADIKMMHVPYRGGGPMLTALLGGEVDMVIGSLPTVISYEQSGMANIIAIGTEEEIKQLPGKPTISSTVPGYKAESWVGMVAPAGLSPEVAEHISHALQKTLADPELKLKMEADGFNVVNSNGPDFKQRVHIEAERWATLIREEGIKVE